MLSCCVVGMKNEILLEMILRHIQLSKEKGKSFKNLIDFYVINVFIYLYICIFIYIYFERLQPQLKMGGSCYSSALGHCQHTELPAQTS